VHSHRAAIDWIESFVAREGLDCDFRRLDGYLMLGDRQDPSILERELAAADRAGIDGVEHVGSIMLGVGPQRPALRFSGQAEIHPLRYLAALALGVQREGGIIFTGAHVERIEKAPTRVIAQGGHEVRCAAVVVATNAPISPRVTLHSKLSAHRTYVVGLALPRGIAPPALFWDTERPYHYMRKLHRDGASEDIILVGGGDHRTGQSDDGAQRYAELEMWARERFPEAGELRYHWSGQILEPVDGLAYIGQVDRDEPMLVATGDSGHGITHGTIAGMLIGAILAGRESPWRKLYDPHRLNFRSLPALARENLNTFGQYRGWLSSADVDDVSHIPRQSGAVLRRGLKRIAAFRDAEGQLHMRSAVCPHLGGVVQWNSSEESWDCPCHGSRFDALGRVICGPANSDLGEPGDEDRINQAEIVAPDLTRRVVKA
jgi:glycine/D-amino acid oxidase-like deaminating enzyme/nitrite reductase/ring-hydroxylating ferredoxin subunit